MKRGRIIVLCVAAAIVFAVVGNYALRPREPAYQGKALSTWLADLDYSQPSFSREGAKTAGDAVRQIGSNAVPRLIEMMRATDFPMRSKIEALCSKQSFIRISFDPPASTQQWRGALGIYELGPLGKPAIPDLIVLLTNRVPWIQGRAAMALGKIGSEARVAVPTLIKVLSDQNPDVRACTCIGLGELGPVAHEALPALAGCLEETNSTVFFSALNAIQHIDGKYPEVIPVLTKRLAAYDRRVRYATATALASRGSQARSAVPALIKALKDPDKDTREAAAHALVEIDPDTAVKAGADTPTGASDGGSAPKVAVNFKNTPVSVVLKFYKSLSGVELVMQFNPEIIPGRVTLQPVKPLTPMEAVVAIESALLDQSNIEMKHIDDKHVSVSFKGPKTR